jgi:hypothetical protein
MSFIQDLQFGNSYETLFLEKYHKNAQNVERPLGCFKAYDLCVDNVKYEVKSDRKTYKSGNICIEYECNGVASGIRTTTADFYVYFVVVASNVHHLYIIPVEYIKEIIADKKYHKDIRGGDGWRAKIYLFDISLFTQFLTL